MDLDLDLAEVGCSVKFWCVDVVAVRPNFQTAVSASLGRLSLVIANDYDESVLVS